MQELSGELPENKINNKNIASNNPVDNVILEFEQFIKQKSFTRQVPYAVLLEIHCHLKHLNTSVISKVELLGFLHSVPTQFLLVAISYHPLITTWRFFVKSCFFNLNLYNFVWNVLHQLPMYASRVDFHVIHWIIYLHFFPPTCTCLCHVFLLTFDFSLGT